MLFSPKRLNYSYRCLIFSSRCKLDICRCGLRRLKMKLGAFIQHFCIFDQSTFFILHSPPRLSKQTFDPSSVLDVMETMVMVTFHEFGLITQTATNNDQLLPLLQLVSSLQMSLLAWTYVQIMEGTETVKIKATHTASTCEFSLPIPQI